MNNDRSGSAITAIGTPVDVEVLASASSYTQAGPRAGVPVPSQSSTMALAARGNQSAGGSLDVQAIRPGFPGYAGAQAVWRNTGETDADWRGCDPPLALHTWEAALWTDGSGVLVSAADPHAVTLDDGTVLVAVQVQDTTTAATRYRVEVLQRSASTGTWTRILVYGKSTAPVCPYEPCMVRLPSGRVLLYHLNSYLSSIDNGTIWVWYSDDNGTTWTYDGVALLDADTIPLSGATAHTPTRMRAAYKDGQVLLIVSVTKPAGTTIMNRARQFASADLGQTFQYVGEWSPVNYANVAYSGAFFEVCATDLGFFVAYAGGGNAAGTSDGVAYGLLVPDAYTSFSLCEVVSQTSSPYGISYNSRVMVGGGTGTVAISDGDLALAVDDAGVLWLYYRNLLLHWGYASVSYDSGRTWQAAGRCESTAVGGTWHVQAHTAGAAADDYPKGFTATWQRGRMLLASPWVASVGNEDNSIGVWYLGGYSTITLPGISPEPDSASRMTWDHIWVPIEEPQDNGWTATGTATTEDLVTPGRHQLTVAAANTRYYELARAGWTTAEGLICAWSLTTSDGDLTTNRIATVIEYSDGIVGYKVHIRFASTGYSVFDGQSGIQIGTNQTTVASSGGIEVMCALYGSSVKVWHRARSTLGAKVWIAGPTSTTLTNAGAITDRIRFGIQAAAAAASTVYWHDFRIGYLNAVGGTLVGATYPASHIGRALSNRWIYLHDGVSVSAADGPAWLGDRWTIATRYDYELRRALDVGSPRITWRTTSTAQQQLALMWRGSTTRDSWGQSELLAIPFIGSNVSQVTLELYDQDTTTWVSVGTANLCAGLDNLRASTAGNAVRPDSAQESTNRPVLRSMEFAGATLRLSSASSRRIAGHTEGRWGAATAARVRPTVLLTGADGTEPTTSTTAAIIPSAAVVILDLAGTSYSGVRITIPAATGTVPQPAEAYYEVGYLRPFWLHLLPQDSDWGQTRLLEAAAEVAEMRDRTRTSRVVAPPRRSVSVSWMDGIDTTEIEGGLQDSAGDYGHAGSEYATLAGQGYQLAGILRRVDGAGDPVLYLERVPTTLQTLTVINRRDRSLLARIDSPISIETAQGDEQADEVIRLASVTLSEEV